MVSSAAMSYLFIYFVCLFETGILCEVLAVLEQAGLELRDLFDSVPQVLGLKGCATMPSS